MIARNRAGQRLATGIGAAALAGLAAAPAPAREAALEAAPRAPVSASVPVSTPAGEPAPRPRVRIAVGPEHVAGGGARYPVRAAIAGKGLAVAFSATPPAPFARPGGVALPGAWPLAAARLTSGFGLRRHPLGGGAAFHAGVDLAAPTGTPVVATAEGTVGTAGWSGGYGLLVALAHPGGTQTRYGHLSALAVAPGERVAQGQVIGYVGSTGRSTGPHLHYEVRVGGVAIDPRTR